jgi:hypothetical protein
MTSDKPQPRTELQLERLQAIKESYLNGRLIPFVGAGYSMVVNGSPSWEGVLRELAQLVTKKGDCKLFRDLKGDPWERLEFLVDLIAKRSNGKKKARGKKALEKVRTTIVEKLRAMESVAETDGSSCHERLVASFRRIYTTNYDQLLEIACRRGLNSQRLTAVTIFDAASAGHERDVWCKQNAVSNSPSAPGPPQIVQIVKFHGDSTLQGQKQMVVTESDYYRRLIDLDAKDMAFMRDLLFHDFLFLGYSFRDPNLKYVLHQMKRLLEEIEPEFSTSTERPKFFLVTTDENQARDEYLRMAYNVSCVTVADYCDREFTEGKFRYGFAQDKKSGCQDGMVVLTKLADLWDLAEASEAEDEIWKDKWEKVFKGSLDRDKYSEIRAEDRPSLGPLRSKVLEVCYGKFLDEIKVPANHGGTIDD